MRYCCKWTPEGIRIVLIIAALIAWTLREDNVKSAFLQNGAAHPDVYVMPLCFIPPRECTVRHFMWRLNNAAYGLGNSYSKWQKTSDDVFVELGLNPFTVILHLFYANYTSENVAVIASKTAEHIVETGEPDYSK